MIIQEKRVEVEKMFKSAAFRLASRSEIEEALDIFYNKDHYYLRKFSGKVIAKLYYAYSEIHNLSIHDYYKLKYIDTTGTGTIEYVGGNSFLYDGLVYTSTECVRLRFFRRLGIKIYLTHKYTLIPDMRNVFIDKQKRFICRHTKKILAEVQEH